MSRVAEGASYADLTGPFGVATPAGARAAVNHARDQLPPTGLGQGARFEFDLISEMGDTLSTHIPFGDIELIDALQRAFAVQWRLLNISLALWLPPDLPDGNDPGPRGAERGEWTHGLQLRHDGASFHRIAAEFGIEETYDALMMVEFDLDAYRRHSVDRLRTVQVNEIDGQLFRLVPAATYPHAPSVSGARTAARLIDRRAQIRGLYYRRSPRRDQVRTGVLL